MLTAKNTGAFGHIWLLKQSLVLDFDLESPVGDERFVLLRDGYWIHL